MSAEKWWCFIYLFLKRCIKIQHIFSVLWFTFENAHLNLRPKKGNRTERKLPRTRKGLMGEKKLKTICCQQDADPTS